MPTSSEKKRLEREFLQMWHMVGQAEWGGWDYPQPEREFLFYAPHRMWRLDFAWPAVMVACEIEGGIFVHGGHNRGPIYADNCEKYNAAAFIGWAVIRMTTQDMKRAPIPTLEEIAKLIQRRTVDTPRAYPLDSYALEPSRRKGTKNVTANLRRPGRVKAPDPSFTRPSSIPDDFPF